MSKNKNKYRRGKAVNSEQLKLAKQLEKERNLNAQLKAENEILKYNKGRKEILDENREAVNEVCQRFLTKDNFPPAFKDDGEQKTIFRSLSNSTTTFLFQEVDEALDFLSALEKQENKPLHPFEEFTWIEDLGKHAVSLIGEEFGHTKNLIKKYISETANVRDKSVGLGEFAHCIIWQNPIKACPDAKGDINILLSEESEYGIWDDKGNGGHMPTIKGHGGKLKTQDKVLGSLYGSNWKKKYSTRGKKTLDQNYMPHILEKNSLKLVKSLEMYSDLGEKESTGMHLHPEDVDLIVKFFEKHPVKSFKKTSQNIENANKREQYLSLLLLRRSCIVNNMSGIRFNYYDEKANVVSTAFLRPAKMSLENLEKYLEEINKYIQFKLVKTNKNSNFAYNDGCIKAEKIS